MYNKFYKTIILILILTLTFISGCTAPEKTDQSNEPLEVFKLLQQGTDVENVMNIIKELASEKYEGRLTCTEGNRLAGDYIANYFKEIGLESLDEIENYKQYYDQTTIVLNSEPLLQVKDKNNNLIKAFEFIDDFNTLPYAGTKINGEAVSQLYYLENTEDFASDNTELKDKILLIPKNLNIDSHSRAGIIDILNIAKDVSGIIFEEDLDNSSNGIDHFLKSVYSPKYAVYPNDGIVLLRCESSSFKELVNYSRNNNNKLNIKVDYTPKKEKVANIVGLIPGKDNKLKNQYIIISAHYDHLGKNYNGTYNPGALDNCSGVASIMEIARAIKSNNIEPKKSILFIAFNGEEEGLYGSQFFAQSYESRLKDSVVINLDMVGHKNDNPIEFLYSNQNKLLEALKNIAKEQDVNFIEVEGGRSDHTPFQQHGIPSVTIIEWETSEYHHYTDTIDKLDKNDFKYILDIIYTYICEEGH